MVTLQEKLNIILHENAIEKEEFANCLGITQSQVDALLTGKRRLTANLARQIEQTFSKPKNWLEVGLNSDDKGPSYDLFG